MRFQNENSIAVIFNWHCLPSYVAYLSKSNQIAAIVCTEFFQERAHVPYVAGTGAMSNSGRWNSDFKLLKISFVLIRLLILIHATTFIFLNYSCSKDFWIMIKDKYLWLNFEELTSLCPGTDIDAMDVIILISAQINRIYIIILSTKNNQRHGLHGQHG